VYPWTLFLFFGTILVWFIAENRTTDNKIVPNLTKIVPNSYHGSKIVPKPYHIEVNRTKLFRPTENRSAQKYPTSKNWRSWLAHNFRYKNPFSMFFSPFESPESQLSIGAKIMKNGFLEWKLWSDRGGSFFEGEIYMNYGENKKMISKKSLGIAKSYRNRTYLTKIVPKIVPRIVPKNKNHVYRKCHEAVYNHRHSDKLIINRRIEGNGTVGLHF
jgi:hypothetical protein